MLWEPYPSHHNLEYSASKVFYGTSLPLPGTMFTPVNNSSTDLSSYISRLRTYFTKQPPMATRPQTTPTHVPQNIDKWTHVFVRNDTVRGPLNSPYLGPFKILSRTKKHFKLDMNGRTEIVSVDRLKKAHFESDVTDLDVVDTLSSQVKPLIVNRNNKNKIEKKIGVKLWHNRRTILHLGHQQRIGFQSHWWWDIWFSSGHRLVLVTKASLGHLKILKVNFLSQLKRLLSFVWRNQSYL